MAFNTRPWKFLCLRCCTPMQLIWSFVRMELPPVVRITWELGWRDVRLYGWRIDRKLLLLLPVEVI